MQADLVAFVTAYLFHITAICLLLADWGAAASHMAYVNSYITTEDIGQTLPTRPKKTYTIVPRMHPFYARKLPLFGDVFHLVAGLRYPVMVLVAVVAYWDAWFWYAGIAGANSVGWFVLKVLHGKVGAWGWKPRWLRQLR